jgi:hypothetical protein
VWNEQVEDALVEYIKSIVKLKNSQDELVSPPVFVRKPDADFEINRYPCISITSLFATKDILRYSSEPIVVSRDYVNKKQTVEKQAKPFSLYYQIDFWATNFADKQNMTMLWCANVWKNFNLDVLDAAGIQRSCFVRESDALRESSILKGNIRIFHSFVTYAIWVELDLGEQTVEPLITSIHSEYVEI